MADVRLENVTKTYDGNVGSPRTALTTPCDTSSRSKGY